MIHQQSFISKETIGMYPLLEDNTRFSLAADFVKQTGRHN